MSNRDSVAERFQPLVPRGRHDQQGLRILILNSDFPVFPGGIGIEFLNTTGLARLAARVGLISMVHTTDVLDRTADLTHGGNVDLFLWRNPALERLGGIVPAETSLGRLHRLLAEFISSVESHLISRPRETFVADLNFRNMANAARSALTTHSWDVLVVVQTSAARVIDHLPKQRVSALVVHDIRSLLYSRRADVASSPIEKWSLRRESRRYFRFEKKYAQRYDVLIALSEDDAAWLRSNYKPRAVEVVPIPVDAAYFAPSHASISVPGRIVFTGLMNHPPNVDAAIFFAREVFPLIRRSVPNAEFFIVGKSPLPEVLALSDINGVTVTGFVPDTRPYMESATVVVVPLRYASGVRNKILEAWGMEKCIVSTKLGAEGLAYEDGVHLAIADGAHELAARVTRCLVDRDYRQSLEKRGRQIAVNRHDPNEIASRYHGILRKLVDHDAECSTLRVAVDLQWMIPGRAGGLENVARSFMRTLQDVDRKNCYSVVAPSCVRFDFDLRHSPNVRIVSRDSVSAIAQDLAWRATQRVRSALGLDYWRSAEVRHLKFLSSLKADTVYSFPGYIHPDFRSMRHVLMVPDIQHEYFPQFFTPEAVEERRRLYGESIERADHICAISEFTRQTLIEKMKVSPERVTTVHLAADSIFSAARDSNDDLAVLSQYRLQPKGYFFFPGHTWRHKNHRAALAALRILRDKYGVQTILVCTGGWREAQSSLQEQMRENDLVNDVRFVGYRSREHLPVLYRNASGLIFPSLFEGFGMPVLEAMASGCPVICSNTTSLPEIAGPAALLVDPNDPEAIAERAYRLMKDVELRNHLVSCGFERASQFSWRRHTLETIAIFHKVRTSLRTH